MSRYGYLLLSINLIFLSGCAAFASSKGKDMYEQGYKVGIHEQVKEVAGQFQGGNFPYYHWSAPIVQEVRVPAHISNGAMIPEHNELVIIQPGQWVMNQAYPIQSQQRKNYDNQVANHHHDVSNITVLPSRMGYNEGADQRAGEDQINPAGME